MIFPGLAVGQLVGWLEVGGSRPSFGTHASLIYLAVGCQLGCLCCFPQAITLLGGSLELVHMVVSDFQGKAGPHVQVFLKSLFASQ